MGCALGISLFLECSVSWISKVGFLKPPNVYPVRILLDGCQKLCWILDAKYARGTYQILYENYARFWMRKMKEDEKCVGWELCQSRWLDVRWVGGKWYDGRAHWLRNWLTHIWINMKAWGALSAVAAMAIIFFWNKTIEISGSESKFMGVWDNKNLRKLKKLDKCTFGKWTASEAEWCVGWAWVWHIS